MKRATLFLIAVAIFCASCVAAEEKTAPEKLGKVYFPVSCTPAAQEQFDRAVAMLHSFWYPQDLKAFAEVANTDPNCAMAYWGVAISRRGNPLLGVLNDPAAPKDALEAVAKARAAGSKTPRELGRQPTEAQAQAIRQSR